ncbi:MAG: hypothetical protein HY811_06670 [Planctomycetes bacterium]|nr:hypothetical protein [Planctomycetota bacterium]
MNKSMTKWVTVFWSLLLVMCTMIMANPAYADSWSEVTFTNGTFVNTVTTTNAAETVLNKGNYNWVRIFCAATPTARAGHVIAYDSARQKVVLFAGYTNNYNNETWEYDGINWSQKSPATIPVARYLHAMAYDPTLQVTVLFGGQDNTGANLYDCYEWDGNNWVSKTGLTSSYQRHHLSLAYDIAQSKLVMFGGYYNFSRNWTHERNSSRTWSLPSQTTIPGSREGYGLSYSSNNKVVMFGGYNDNGTTITYLQDTWEHTSGASQTWTNKNPANKPSARVDLCMVYDSDRQKVVLLGGEDETYTTKNDTWEWNGTNWSQLTPATNPPTRMRHSMAYDSVRKRIVLFGGETSQSGSKLNDTWEYFTPYLASGNYTSIAIQPSEVSYWGILTYTIASSTNTTVTIDVLKSSDDSLLAVNIQPGTDLSSAYPAIFNGITGIKLRANFSTSNPSQTPTLYEWGVTYYKGPVVTTTNWVDLVNGNAVKMGQSVAYVKFDMKTNSGIAKWKRFRIDKGVKTYSNIACPDNKIEIQVWMENNNNGLWDIGDAFISKGIFGNGICWLNMKRWQVTTTSRTYYIVYKLSGDIGGGQRAGVKIVDSSYLEFEDATCIGVP